MIKGKVRLQSKHLFPRLKTKTSDIFDLVQRNRLLDLVQRNKYKKLIVINAGAGYGKTALLSQLYDSMKQLCVWYTFEKDDRLPTFTSDLITKVETISSQSLSSANSTSWAEVAESKIDTLTTYVNKIAKDRDCRLNIFLDDFHLIEGNKEICREIQFLINHLPEGCRVFIAGRNHPNLQLARMRGQRRLLEVGNNDLKFTEKETTDILRSVRSYRSFSTKQIQQLIALIDGWPAALAFFVGKNAQEQLSSYLQALETENSPDFEILLELKQYIDDNIWRHLNEDLRLFLIKASLTNKMIPEILDAVLEKSNSSNLLAAAEDHNLPMEYINEGSGYRFQPLIRSFLRRQATKKLSKQSLTDLHTRFARAYLSAKNNDEAVNHFLAAGELESAAKVMEKAIMRGAKTSELEVLAHKVSNLPVSMLKKYPGLNYFKGLIKEYEKDYVAALEFYEKAIKAAYSNASALGIFNCELAAIKLLSNINMSGPSLAKIIKIVDIGVNIEQKIELNNNAAINHLLLGRIDEAENILKQSNKLSRKSKEPGNYSNQIASLVLKYHCGDFDQILSDTARLLEKLQFIKTQDHIFAIFFYRILALQKRACYTDALSLHLQAQNMLRQECAHFMRELRILEKQNMLYGAQANGGIEIILNEYTNDAQTNGVIHDFVLNVIGTFERRQGNLTKALQIHRKSLDFCRKENLLYATACALQNIGADKFRLGDGKKKYGEKDLLESLDMARKLKYRYIECQALFHLAAIYQMTGHPEEALQEITRCLNLAARFSYTHFLVQEGRSNLELLSFAFRKNVEARYLLEIFQKIGPHTISIMTPALKSRDSEIKKATMQAIVAIGGQDGTSYIRPMLRDVDPLVRSEAEKALKKFRISVGPPEKVLTRRELEVLGLIAAGLGNAEIGKRLFISEPTVKTHITRIFNKLGISKRSQVIAFYNSKLYAGAESK